MGILGSAKPVKVFGDKEVTLHLHDDIIYPLTAFGAIHPSPLPPQLFPVHPPAATGLEKSSPRDLQWNMGALI